MPPNERGQLMASRGPQAARPSELPEPIQAGKIMRYWRLLLRKLVRSPRCRGTVEDHRRVALDVRELIRQHVFERPVGSVFHLGLRFP